MPAQKVYDNVVNVYLDIDGVLLASEKQPALHVHDFVEHLVSNHDVYWLTTHCRTADDYPHQPLYVLRSLEPETLTLLKQVKATQWDTLKTEAIDFSQPFRWYDDDVFEEERAVLRQKGLLSSWVEIDLSKNPNQLVDLIAS
ncbi:MAG: hypothetical protein COT71_00545 [Candidatus Andersenbacteria bacterium CG10_big_fil_rev_8_21_14_0_10_54_11]|uniref:HAD family hydrolase n=1 Tax=Candidatus Andersenbacteria bacterium CG10_big_fil_rev_8_21_14_0_10_54_11 TaxID=1974485 RepID=A0A2M6X0B0_9BACT|nr:MAG: hypothetical protein COT71_00545 [Candidatus Andersenbacteria bacterium CG10_big_fil_rev_8_21_14_0_10_54_11]